MQSRQIVVNLLEQGIIGEVTSLKATFNTPNFAIRRMHDPALAGGALLDLGMYTLTFASMFFGNDVERMESRCRKYKTGVDATDHIRLFYRDGKKAELMTSMTHLPKCEGILYGSRGKIRIQNINNFSRISVYEKKTRSWNDYEPPKQINGYEYEILACKRAIEAGQIECEEMPHTETLCMMQWMDELRGQWGIVYPFE
jgi:predicted dehydrogenase